MMYFKQTLAAGSLSLLLAGNALALNNGDFSGGLTGWSALGDVSIPSGAALLTNAAVSFEDDYPAAAGVFNYSGSAAAEVGVPNGVEEFSGLDIGDLDPDVSSGVFAYEGSALKQTFSLQAGQVVKFDWQFFTNEGNDGSGQQDYAYFAVNGVKTVLADPLDATTSSTPFSWETGLSSFYYTFTGTGPATLAFGVVDVGDFVTTSALRVDNVQIVPLPAAAWLLGPALLSLLGFRRKQVA